MLRSGAGQRVLVVDHEPAILVIFKKVLSRDGHRVHTCASAAEALSELAQARFDLVVVEKNLPGISGFDLLALLRKELPDLPAIMITTYPEPNLRPMVRLQGYLTKPFESLRLISETVSRVLAAPEPRRERRSEMGPVAALALGSR